MEVLDLLVELGVLERQGHELGDRFSDGDLLLGELALDVVEEVDQADDLVARDQGQRDRAELTQRCISSRSAVLSRGSSGLQTVTV